MKNRTGKFRQWWAGIRRHPYDRQQEILGQWLKYACKTVAIRGDQDEQRLVYTVSNRFANSQWPRLSTENARKVFKIVNHKQERHRAERQLINKTNRPVGNKPTIVVKRSRTKRIITG
jgi:ribosomal protein S8E